jgi:hypothetical protein
MATSTSLVMVPSTRLRQRAEQEGVEGAEQDAERAEDDRTARQHEHHGHARHDQQAERHHHDEVQDGPRRGEVHPSAPAGAAGRPGRAPPASTEAERISTETDCRASSTAMVGISA